jgi:thymidylate kinase
MTQKTSQTPPMIAIVGCDGSGKSTVGEQVLVCAEEFAPSVLVHVGKQAGNFSRSLFALPVIGGLIKSLFGKQAVKTRSRREKNKNPSFLPSLAKYIFTVRRVRRFRKMLALRKKGLIMITDRFPQLELKAFDGPQLDVEQEAGFMVRWFARREHADFEWMTSHIPDLVIRLNVDIDTAMERKPDHNRESLSKKIGIMPQLTYQGAPIVDIDTSQPLEKVVAEATAALSALLTERGYSRSTS